MKDYIINAFSKHIEARLKLFRRYQELSNESEAMSLDTFIVLINQYESSLDVILKDEKRTGIVETISKDGQEVALKDGIIKLKKTLISEKYNSTIFSDNNIEDIVKMVKRFFVLDENFLNIKSTFTETSLIRMAINTILESDDEKEYINLAKKYVNYFKCNQYAGMNKELACSMSLGALGMANISVDGIRNIFKIDSDGHEAMPYNDVEDYALFNDDIYFITLRNRTYPYRKTTIGNQEVYQDIYYLNDSVPRYVKVSDVEEAISLNTILADKNLNEYKKVVYTYQDFRYLLGIIRSFEHFTSEEFERIDKISTIASEWWTKKINTVNKNVLESNNDLVSFLMGSIQAKIGNYDDETLANFQKVLKDEITKRMLCNSCFFIETDYHPDGLLSTCCEKAGINPDSLPMKTFMQVSLDEVKATGENGLETLFNINDKKRD